MKVQPAGLHTGRCARSVTARSSSLPASEASPGAPGAPGDGGSQVGSDASAASSTATALTTVRKARGMVLCQAMRTCV